MFNINPAAAKSYDQRGGYISQAGKYTGKIESLVWHVKDSQSGQSQGVFLNFISDDRQKARFYINTSYHGGTQNERGIATINALLSVIRERSSGDPVPCTIKEYDKDLKQEVDVQRECFARLHGKPLGIVVQMVHEDGQERPKPELYSLFEPATEMTASEIHNRATEPAQLGKVLAYIADNPMYDKRRSGSVPPPPKRQEQPTGRPQPQDDIDDDIPF